MVSAEKGRRALSQPAMASAPAGWVMVASAWVLRAIDAIASPRADNAPASFVRLIVLIHPPCHDDPNSDVNSV
jgi:hypothetical protein